MFETLDLDTKFIKQIEYDINNSRLSHAIILEGSDEITRISAATEIAQAILCSSENKPCGECKSCRKVINSAHPDLHFLKKDEKASMIKVDDIRELKHQAQLLPNDGAKSVFIIIEAQYMNPQAQNALLKIFEEPAAHVNFILTAPSKSAFLETIISRGASYSLSSDNQSTVETEETAKAYEIAVMLSRILCSGNEYDFMAMVASIKKDKELLSLTNKKLSELMRDALVLKNGITKDLNSCSNEINKVSQLFSTEKLLKNIEHSKNIEARIKSNANFNILITEFCCGFYN